MEIGQGISLAGLFHEDWQYPFYVSGAVTQADVGKAVTLDTTAQNTVKLAGDGDPILGRLETFEDRTVEGVKVGTVSIQGGMKFPKTAAAIAVGNSIVGGGGGLVKADVSANGHNVVVEVGADYVVAILK